MKTTKEERDRARRTFGAVVGYARVYERGEIAFTFIGRLLDDADRCAELLEKIEQLEAEVGRLREG